MSLMASFCAVLFPTRCLGWDLGLNWVSFWWFSYSYLFIDTIYQIVVCSSLHYLYPKFICFSFCFMSHFVYRTPFLMKHQFDRHTKSLSLIVQPSPATLWKRNHISNRENCTVNNDDIYIKILKQIYVSKMQKYLFQKTGVLAVHRI